MLYLWRYGLSRAAKRPCTSFQSVLKFVCFAKIKNEGNYSGQVEALAAETVRT
jgi:hypothetical protein